VGYCKPVGQKVLDFDNLKVDKDAILFADLIHFEIVPNIHSPVILAKGATEKYLDDPSKFNFVKNIRNANKVLSSQHEITIFEGTGHPGVGSVAELSNARVAKLVEAKTLMVVEGGIGSTIDMLNMSLSLFREEKVNIIGVIVNKVIPEKKDKVEYYVKKWLTSKKLDLCGIIPYEQTLAYPLIRTINESINGTIEYGDAFKNNYVSNILAGSLIDLSELKSNENLLLLVDARSLSSAINRIKWLTDLFNIDHCPLSGVVITGHGPIDQKSKKYIRENNLPVLRTDLDTYGAVIRISKIEVKINKNTPWKVDKAIDLIEHNVDLDMILDKCRL
jgi:hypothetical protein